MSQFVETGRKGKGATAQASAETVATIRIDVLLWYLRLAKSRALARGLCESGHLRLNGRRVERGHLSVRIGDVLTVPTGSSVRVLRIDLLPRRRGPPAEAQHCYAEIK